MVRVTPDGCEKCPGCGATVQVFKDGEGRREFAEHFKDYPVPCLAKPSEVLP